MVRIRLIAVEPIRFLKLLKRTPQVSAPVDAPLSGTTEGNDPGLGRAPPQGGRGG